MLVPERTIDMWTAMAVRSYLPDALVWGPTPWEQSRDKPWDVSVRNATGKLLVIENKGVQDDGSVLIDREQLGSMCDLQQDWRARGARNVVLYGLPQIAVQPSDWMATQQQFDLRHVMYRPETLRQVVNRWGWYRAQLPQNIDQIVRRKDSFRIRFHDPLVHPLGARNVRLLDVLCGLPQCRWGAPIGPGWSESRVDIDDPDLWLDTSEVGWSAEPENEATPPQLLWWPKP